MSQGKKYQRSHYYGDITYFVAVEGMEDMTVEGLNLDTHLTCHHITSHEVGVLEGTIIIDGTEIFQKGDLNHEICKVV